MKTFNSLKDLYNYFSYCPVCKRDDRNVIMSVGPAKSHDLISYELTDQDLIIYSTYKEKNVVQYRVNYKINLLDCSHQIDVLDMVEPPPIMDIHASFEEEEKSYQISWVKKSYFRFKFQTVCYCKKTILTSNYIELVSNKPLELSLIKEHIDIISFDKKYSISCRFDINKAFIYEIKANSNGQFFKDWKAIEYPSSEFNFNNLESVYNNIQTFLLFR